MTRKSERELERSVDDLEVDESDGKWANVQTVFVYEDGTHRTPDGELVDPDEGETIIRIGGEPPENEPGGRR